jgi:hypothetical protein
MVGQRALDICNGKRNLIYYQVLHSRSVIKTERGRLNGKIEQTKKKDIAGKMSLLNHTELQRRSD